MSQPTPDQFPLTTELMQIAEAVRSAGGRGILVGGWVRDCLLGILHSKDFDIEVFAMDAGALKDVLTRFGPVHTVGRHFGVLKLTTRDAEYDISVPRRESKTGKGHKGFWVTPDPTMTFEQAAARRDFTINAMGYAPLDREFLDPCNGLDDLKAGILRHVGPAFGEDPLRVLRAMQFAGRFGFAIVPETIAICRAQDLTELPRERLWEEVRKLLMRAERPSTGLTYARDLGVLEIFPELGALEALRDDQGHSEAWRLTLATVDHAARLRKSSAGEAGVEADLALTLAALCHLLGNTLSGHGNAPYDAALGEASVPPTRSFLGRLTNEQELPRRVVPLVKLLPRVEALYKQRDALPFSAIRELALEVPIAELACLSMARERALSGIDAAPMSIWLEEKARADAVWEQPLEPLLKGRHLLSLGLSPGPQLKPILEEAYALQLEGKFSTLEDAQVWARERITSPSAEGKPVPRVLRPR